jgi:hypothetical protein
MQATTSGTVENADLAGLDFRLEGGVLVGYVSYKVTVGGRVEQRTASWTLTAAQRTAVTAMLPDAKAAIKSAEGI